MKKSEDEMERNKRPGLWKDGNSAHSRGGKKVESVVVKVGSDHLPPSLPTCYALPTYYNPVCIIVREEHFLSVFTGGEVFGAGNTQYLKLTHNQLQLIF